MFRTIREEAFSSALMIRSPNDLILHQLLEPVPHDVLAERLDQIVLGVSSTTLPAGITWPSECSVPNLWDIWRPCRLQSVGRDYVVKRGSAVPHAGILLMLGDRRLQIVAVAHLGLGVVFSVLSRFEVHTQFGLEHILMVPFFALALCQALLLSLWGAASHATLWIRLAALVAGAVYLEALFPSDLRREFLGTSAITIVVTTATLLVMRWVGVSLTRQDDSDQSARQDPEGLRFSIRGMMIFTAAVALLCAGARALQESATRPFLLILVWALCFVAVGLVSLWAVLGDSQPLRRGPVVFFLSPALGAFFAFAANAHKAGWIYIVLTMLLYPLALLASLLVVRSRGYRLIRRAVPTTSPPDDRGRSEMANGGTST